MKNLISFFIIKSYRIVNSVECIYLVQESVE